MSRSIQNNRAGVTVIEVLFATGIVIFGLIGIASLIAVAGRQVTQSNEAVEGQAVARLWYSDFVSRGFNDASTWRWYNDQAAPASRYVTFTNSGAPATGTSAGGSRTAFRHAICIDPAFFADATTSSSLGLTFASGQVYRPGLFPYYQDNYDPLTYPITSPGFSTTVNMPRLLRVSLQLPGSSFNPMPAKLVEQLFMSRDDLSKFANEQDQTISAVRIFDGTASKSLSGAKYSWFATLCPREFLSAEVIPPPALPGLTANTSVGEKYYTLSIVVLSQRDRTFFIPTTDTNPEGLPQGERLLRVSSPTASPPTPPTNFRDGGGGRVKLTGPDTVSDKIRVGDWVMLSKNMITPAPANLHVGTVCRWFRVIGLSAESEIVGATWSRDVILDGPDWFFDALGTARETQATLVSNVVTVLERVIPVF